MESLAISQVVSYQLLTVEAQVHTQASSCFICGGDSATGTDLFSEKFCFPCQCHHPSYSLL